jgi:hypothetical protein
LFDVANYIPQPGDRQEQPQKLASEILH